LTRTHKKTYMVRTDCLDSLSSTTTVAALQAYIRTLDQSSSSFPGVTADLTGATVTASKIGILTAAVVA
jgi:NAD/NADP transhydrogenase alpha subunit